MKCTFCTLTSNTITLVFTHSITHLPRQETCFVFISLTDNSLTVSLVSLQKSTTESKVTPRRIILASVASHYDSFVSQKSGIAGSHCSCTLVTLSFTLPEEQFGEAARWWGWAIRRGGGAHHVPPAGASWLAGCQLQQWTSSPPCPALLHRPVVPGGLHWDYEAEARDVASAQWQ